MAVITHRLNDGTDKALCGEKLSCVPGADVWHILLTAQDFNNDEITQGTRCADCADISRNAEFVMFDSRLNLNAKFMLNTVYEKMSAPQTEDVRKADLQAAFKIVEERDKEITELRQDILRLDSVNKRVGEKLSMSEKDYIKARDVIIDQGGKLADLKRENVRLENELRYAKAENAPLARQNQRLAKNRDVLVDALNAVDNAVKDARETLKEVAK